jgi:ABC-type phosphate transport system ATPase subunit
MSGSYAVEARGLVKRYGSTIALGGVDLEIPTGTVTAVLGPNGAGKTTAVRILTTLAEADEGEATVAGFDVRTQGTEVRRRIGLAAQFGNPNTPTAPGDPWSIAHPMAYSVIWIVGIVAVCAPLAVRAYQRSIDR